MKPVPATLYPSYTRFMARGWESKSVEAQQDDAREKSQSLRRPMTPEQAAYCREQESLRLSRQRILQQLDGCQNPRYRKLMEETLAELDSKIGALARGE